MVVVFHADAACVAQVCDVARGTGVGSGPHTEENTEVHCLVHPEIGRKVASLINFHVLWVVRADVILFSG